MKYKSNDIKQIRNVRKSILHIQFECYDHF